MIQFFHEIVADHARCWSEEEATAETSKCSLCEYELIVLFADTGHHDRQYVGDCRRYEKDLVLYG